MTSGLVGDGLVMSCDFRLGLQAWLVMCKTAMHFKRKATWRTLAFSVFAPFSAIRGSCTIPSYGMGVGSKFAIKKSSFSESTILTLMHFPYVLREHVIARPFPKRTAKSRPKRIGKARLLVLVGWLLVSCRLQLSGLLVEAVLCDSRSRRQCFLPCEHVVYG